MLEIRQTFPLHNGRIDTTRMPAAQQNLAERTNELLDAVDLSSSEPRYERDGNRLSVDSHEGAHITHEEVYFEPALDLSIAEYPDEALDRTYLTRYDLIPGDGSITVEKSTSKTYGEPDHPGWNLTNPPVHESKHGLLSFFLG